MKNNTSPRYAFDLQEAADAVGVSRPVMLEWVKLPDFPAWKSARKWIIPCDLFKQWLEEQARNHRVLFEPPEDQRQHNRFKAVPEQADA